MEDPRTKIQLQILVHYPCNTIEYIANAVTLQKISDGSIHFPLLTAVPSPEYIVQPGQDLSLPFKTEAVHTDRVPFYGFSRHLRREGDRLTVEQRLDNKTRYKYGDPNVTYTKRIQPKGADGVERFSVLMNFKPWSATDSGVYIVSLSTSYAMFFRSDPYGHYISFLIRAYFDVRSRQVVPPALIVYNELDWMFRGQPAQFESNGNYIVPLSRTSKWAQSVRCIAHASTNPVLSAKVSITDPNLPWQTFANKSTIIHTNTVTSDAFAIENGTHRLYTCKARAAGKETTLTFWTTWFTPFKLVSRSPSGRPNYISRNRVSCLNFSTYTM
jgi:hypothetical protein